MEQPYTGRRTLLPKPQPRELGSQSLNAQSLATFLSTSTIPARPASRQPKSNPKTDEEWERQRPNIEQLYLTDDLSLPEVMREMEGKYHFKASRKQYNNKISQWRVGKNVKTNEMRAIVRKTRERKMEDPPKASVFRVRSRPVDPDKIERFTKDKGIGEDVVMADAATPSDISCITPQPSNSEITGQSSHQLFERSSVNRFSPVELTPSFASYHPILSSDLPVVSSNPTFGQLDVGQQSPFHNPTPSHRLPSISPGVSRRSPVYWRKSMSDILQSPLNGSRLGSHSPVYWRTSPSPVLDLATPSRYSLSPYPGHQALSSFANSSEYSITFGPTLSEFEWFDAFVNYSDASRSLSMTSSGNYVSDVLRGLITEGDVLHGLITDINTSKGQKQHEELNSRWSDIKSDLGIDGTWLEHDSDVCKAWDAGDQLLGYFRFRGAHDGCDCRPYTMDQDFLISETFRELVPGIESNDIKGLKLGRCAALLLFLSGRHQDGESVVRAIIQGTERQTSLDVEIKESMTLALAEDLIQHGRHEQAEHLVRDVLKEDFSAISMMAADAVFSNLEGGRNRCEIPNIHLGYEAEVTETHPGYEAEVPEIHLGYEREVAIRKRMCTKPKLGEVTTVNGPILFKALSILSKLNAHHVEEVTDEERVANEEEVVGEEEG